LPGVNAATPGKPGAMWRGEVSPSRSTDRIGAPHSCPEGGTVIDWQRLVSEHGPAVFGTAWRILGHAADAEDVTQDGSLQAYETALTQAVRCWPALLRGLAVGRARDRLRLRKCPVALDDVALAAPGPDPAETLIAAELADRLRTALAGLPRQEAAVFALRY